MKLAIIGCGNIGGTLGRTMQKQIGDMHVVAVYDIDRKKAERLATEITPTPIVCKNVEELLKRKEVDVVLEAASADAVAIHGRKILESGKNLMVMSVGAFTDDVLLKDMRDAAEKKKVKFMSPLGRSQALMV